MLTKILSVHFTPTDLNKLDRLVSSNRRATRHLVHLLAVREGLKRLTAADVDAATRVMATRVMRQRAESVST